jgi:hypothetical protein
VKVYQSIGDKLIEHELSEILGSSRTVCDLLVENAYTPETTEGIANEVWHADYQAPAEVIPCRFCENPTEHPSYGPTFFDEDEIRRVNEL